MSGITDMIGITGKFRAVDAFAYGPFAAGHIKNIALPLFASGLVVLSLAGCCAMAAESGVREIGQFPAGAPREAPDTALYRVQEHPGRGYRALNQAQRIAAEFVSGRTRLRHSQRDVEVQFTGYGYSGERLRTPAVAEVLAEGNRVEYRRGALREWWINGPRGLEQGFTLAEPPSTVRTGRTRPGRKLVLTMSWHGNLRPERAGRDNALELRAADQPVLRYDGLLSWDATGRHLPSRFEVRGQQVNIVLDDSGAVYPVTVDPLLTEDQKLTAPHGDTRDFFGRSVAVSGDTLVVGSFWDDIGNIVNQGSVYVYERRGDRWVEQARLTASDAHSGAGAGMGGPLFGFL